MTKELEALKTLKIVVEDEFDLLPELDTIEKALKALEIIKKIFLNDLVFDDEKQVIKFSSGFSIVYTKIKDKAEYKLLKEVLK